MTTKKHRMFIMEPIGEKSTLEVAGIGPVYGSKLAEKGYGKAYTLLGMFLLLKKSEELFTEWLQDACGANKTNAALTFNCLREWCDAFL